METVKVYRRDIGVDFETLEQVVLNLVERGGPQILNYERPTRWWVYRLIQAGAPIHLLIQQFGKSIAGEPYSSQRQRAEGLTSLGFLLFEFWSLEGQALPASISQVWNSTARRSA